MKWASGSTSIKIPKDHHQFITVLERDGYLESRSQLLELALAIGLRENLRRPLESYEGAKPDAAKVGQFDPDETLSEAIMQRYGSHPENERFDIVVEHMLAGIERIQEHYLENEGLDMGRLLSERE